MTDRRRRGARAGAMRGGGLAAFVALVAGCGIQPTAVVDAGAPPSGAATARPEPTPSASATSGEVYFVSAGTLIPVSRPDLHDRAQRATGNGDLMKLITVSMQVLLAGPSADESATGMTTDLPRQPSQTRLQVSSPSSDPFIVQLVMPLAADELSPLAAFQITCTVRAAAQATGRTPNVIVVFGYQRGRVKPLPSCPIGPIA